MKKETTLIAWVSNTTEINIIGEAIKIAVAQSRKITTGYERINDTMCWVVIIENKAPE